MLPLPQIMYKTAIAIILLFFVLIPEHMLFAGDSYHICARKPDNNLSFVQQADGASRYEFSGNLVCHVHYNYKAFSNLPHDTPDEFGTYHVVAWFKGKTLHEKIWIEMPHHYGGAPAIDTIYSCSSNPFRNGNTQCTKVKRTTPNKSEWQGAVEEAAGFTVPLSIGLASTSSREDAASTGRYVPGPDDQKSIVQHVGNLPAPSLYDITLDRVRFSDDRRNYFFSFNHLAAGRYEKMEAMATKYIREQKVDISIRGSDHHIDLSYRCDSIMDPFLDRRNNCTLTNAPSSSTDSLYQAIVNNKKSFNLVKLFVEAIPNGKRKKMIWEALAKSMQPAIFEGGKKQAPQESKIIFTTDTNIVLQVESARDIKRSGDWPVFFFIIRADGTKLTNTSGAVISMPLASKYTGNSYNGAVRTIRNLAPGKYIFFTSMMTSLTSKAQSKKIPFEVFSHLSPKQAPVIISPQENEKIKKGNVVHFNILVSQPVSGTGFVATVQCEHSRLRGQYPYKPYKKIFVSNPYEKEIASTEYVFNDFPGDFRCRARMIHDGKEVGQWSDWRHFQIKGKTIPHMHRDFAILSPSPLRMDSYTNMVPVRIMLPKNLSKKSQLTLKWAWGWNALNTPNANGVPQASIFPHEFLSETVTVSPGLTYDTTMPVAKLSNARKSKLGYENKAGYYRLQATLKTANQKTTKTSGDFTVGELGTAAHKQEKKSGTLLLATPIFTRPAEGQIFMAPAKVEVTMIHQQDVQVRTELGYCPFSKKKMSILSYQTLRIKPVSKKQKNKGTTTLIYELKKPGFYRIRAINHNKTGTWSQWRSFKVDTMDSKTVSSTKLLSTQRMVYSKISMPLAIMPHPWSFRPTESIKISVKNTSVSRLPFELRYRQSAGKPYRLVKQPRHFFSGENGMTTLHLNLKKPGQYQIRFRANNRAPWTNWSFFQVMGNPAKSATFAQKMRVSPVTTKTINPQPEPPGKIIRNDKTKHMAQSKGHTSQLSQHSAARMINPQPEPPGKVMHGGVVHHQTPGIMKPNNHLPASGIRTVTKIHIAPPRIIQPHNGQQFMLMGSSVHIKTKVEYAGKEKIQVAVQQGKKGSYINLNLRTSMSRSGNITTIDIPLTATGNYRLKVRVGNNGLWSHWTTFKVDRLMRKIPTRHRPVPQIQTTVPAHKPLPSAKHGLKLIH